MAASQARPHLPLQKLTNDELTTSSRENSKETIPVVIRSVQNTHSFDFIPKCNDPVELEPDENDIVHTTAAVLSSRAARKRELSSEESWHLAPSTPVLISDSDTSKPSNSNRLMLSPQFGLAVSHSGWLPSQCRAIIEQRMVDSSLSSASLPQLQNTPQYVSEIVQPKSSVYSIHIKRSTCLPQSSPTTYQLHWRSFSLNDLECLSDITYAKYNTRSSSESVASIPEGVTNCLQLSFPTRPLHSPPRRVPTPPGLPSFGTRQALLYRLDIESKRSRRSPAFSRWLQRRHGDRSNQSVVNLHFTGPQPASHHEQQSLDLRKQFLGITGISRIISPLPQPFNPTPRVSLPAGIRRSSSPGPLAKAEDGTFVRATFPARASAHGIGRRRIENHPYSTRFTSIDEVVGAIDKACDERLRAQPQEQYGQALGLDEEVFRQQALRQSQEEEGRDSRQLYRSEDTVVDGFRNPNTDKGLPFAQSEPSGYVQPPLMEFFSSRPPSLTPNSSSQQSSDFGRVYERVCYPQTESISTQNPGTMMVFRRYVEEGERAQVWQAIMESRRKKQNCWTTFCSRFCLHCCGNRLESDYH